MSADLPDGARQPLTRGELWLLVVLALAVVHHIDHVLRADNGGWPFTSDVTPFTISLIVYPIFALDFLFLRGRPGIRAGLVGSLFVLLLFVHSVVETPGDQYGTWARGVSSVSHAAGRPNLLGVASPVLGIISVTISVLLSVSVLIAFVLILGEARRARGSA